MRRAIELESNKIRLVLLSVFLLIFACALFACATTPDGGESGEGTIPIIGDGIFDCTDHEDLNNDGFCELCGAAMEMPQPDPEPDENTSGEGESKSESEVDSDTDSDTESDTQKTETGNAPTTDNTPKISVSDVDYYITTNIFIKYYVLCENVESVEGLKLLVWRSVPSDLVYREGSESEQITNYTTEVVGDKEYFVFEYSRLKYTEMAEPLYVRAVIGQALASKVNKYSILSHAYRVLGKLDPDDKSSDAVLCDKHKYTLDFGASMQKYLEVGLDRPISGNWYEISAEHGKLPDGFSEGMYLCGDTVRLTAATYANKEFSHWELNGAVVGKEKTLEITVGEANACYKAVYK